MSYYICRCAYRNTCIINSCIYMEKLITVSHISTSILLHLWSIKRKIIENISKYSPSLMFQILYWYLRPPWPKGFVFFLVIQDTQTHTDIHTLLKKCVQARAIGISASFFFFFKVGLKLVLSSSIRYYWKLVSSQAWAESRSFYN